MDGDMDVELIVGADRDPDVAPIVHAQFPDAQVLSLSGLHLGAARNELVARSSGALVLFLDDDTSVPSGLLHSLARLAAEHPNVGVFGGPNVTPPGRPAFEQVQGAVLASAVGAGPVRRRYGARSPRLADERSFTLCNLAIRRSCWRPFSVDMVGGEENDLLTRLHEQGVAMWSDPALSVDHARRKKTRSFATQMWKYGIGRGEALRRSPRSLRAAYLAPIGAIASVLLVPVLVALMGPIGAVPAGLYLGAAIGGALGVAWRLQQLARTPLALGIVLLVHACYAGGIIRGVFRQPRPAASRALIDVAPVTVRS